MRLQLLVPLVATFVVACTPLSQDDDDAGGEGEGEGDAGPGGTRAAVEACVATRAPAPERVDTFTDATSTTWVALGRTRDPDSFGTSGTTPWFGDALAVSSSTTSFCVVDRAAIEYTVSHHNFADEAEATDDGTTVRVVFDIQDYDDLTPELHLFVDGVQAATLAPVE